MLCLYFSFKFLTVIYQLDTLTQITYLHMKKQSLILLVAILVLQIHSQDLQAVFAFSWLKGHCISIGDKCDETKYDLWDHQSFTIHGMWPQTTTTESFGSFNLNIITSDSELFDNLLNYMPPQSRQTGKPYFLWEHEWKQHGHDWASYFLKIHPEKFENKAQNEINSLMQKTFFEELINFYKSYQKVRKTKISSFSMQELASLFGVKENELNISCSSAKTLREVKVCVKMTKEGYVPTSCPPGKNAQVENGCSKKAKYPKYTLPDWEQRSQIRVTERLESQKNELIKAAEGFNSQTQGRKIVLESSRMIETEEGDSEEYSREAILDEDPSEEESSDEESKESESTAEEY